MTQANDERAARKEYIRRRQKTVFSIVGAVMVVAMVVSLLFFFHVGGLGNVKSAAVQPNYGQQAPCPIKEADGNKAKYVENRNITLRVLNGTKFSGLRQGGERRVAEPRVQPPDAGQLHQEGGSHDDRLRQERRESRRTPWKQFHRRHAG